MATAAAVLAAAAAVAALFFHAGARVASARLNRVDRGRGRLTVSEHARALHRTLRVVDLHDDILLWDRDPLRRSRSGHGDVPRLLEGNVSVQVFSAVTRMPRGANDAGAPSHGDHVTLLALASRWPPRTWGSLLERALHQAGKLRAAAARSDGALALVTSRAELAAALAARAGGSDAPRTVAGILAVEGLHALEGRLAHVDTLFEAGFRCAGLAHFFDNDVAGSAHGVERGGLTAFGRAVLSRMEQLRMVVDLAHASTRTVDDVLEAATRPVLVSHTGLQSIRPGPRNLSDDQLRRLASRGGLVGIGFWEAAAGDISPRGVARSVRRAVDVAGRDHVALGSDWDGGVTVAVDSAHLVELTQALLDEGSSEQEVRAVLGENALRFLLANLP